MTGRMYAAGETSKGAAGALDSQSEHPRTSLLFGYFCDWLACG